MFRYSMASAARNVLLVCCWTLCAITPAISRAADQEAPVLLLAAAQDRPQPDSARPQASSEKSERPSEAEYIARLQRAIEADRKQLDALSCQEQDPQGEYPAAEAEFERLDSERARLASRLDEARRRGKRQEVAQLTEQMAASEAEWSAAKDRFDLALQVRKALRAKAANLQEKIKQDSHTLETFTGSDFDFDPTPASAVESPVTSAPAEESIAPSPPSPATPPASTAADEVRAAIEKATPSFPRLEFSQSPIPGSADASPALLLAQQQAHAKLIAAQQADERARSATERFEALRKSIEVEQELLNLARTRADQAQESWTALNQQLQPKLAEDPTSLDALTKKIEQASKRFADARDEARVGQQRLDELHAQLVDVQEERTEALRIADTTRAAASEAESRVSQLQNPFTLQNILQWLFDHTVKLLTILIGTLALNLSVKFSGRHLVSVMTRTGSRGTLRERENRALTLVGVFRNVASLTIVTGGILMALDEVGIPIMPLLGGAAVLGLAVAFGAQNLVRDYFSGFMVLLEDQYGINDVVKIGDVSGAVEQITLRMTVLRDMEGSVHFIPHGNITRVSNMTHGWSRAVLEVAVSYREDPDHVMQILMDVASNLRKDDVFGPLILDEPEMLGVDSFNDHNLNLKFTVKTHPLKRWPVKRELLRRIKYKFDQLGIEVPSSQKQVFLQTLKEEEQRPASGPVRSERAA